MINQQPQAEDNGRWYKYTEVWRDGILDYATREPIPTAEQKPASWLDIAKEITSSDRQRDYGRPLKNFLRIALSDNVDEAGRRNPSDFITPLDVAHRMVGMKKSRDLNAFKEDNWIDTMGYSATVQDMDNQMKELGYANGVQAFSTMSIGAMYNLLDSLVRSGS